jgi:beta-lactamase superfamily II metal-dependent hydrolase
LAAAVFTAPVTRGVDARTLDIYFIDVEGGQATLLVTPASQALLVDAGFPGAAGTFQAAPGNPEDARDAPRIAAAARDAGVARIDDLLVTHFHADHDGGIVELAQLLPIGTFIDHGGVLPEAEQTVRGTLNAFRLYAAVRDQHKHLEPKPGARLPLKGIDARVVSTASVVAKPLRGAGTDNPACGQAEIKAQEPNENPRSTGIRVQFGKFRFLDVGDLTGRPLHELVCPKDRVGPVDVYLVAHHGEADAADQATLAAFRPRVAILNNGATKGGAPATLAALRVLPDTDVWQLHRSETRGAENVADARIANLDVTTAHWIKLRAHDDGSFEVTNGRTGMTKQYPGR